MTLTEWQQLSAEGYRPLPGRCVIHLDAPPVVAGSIVIPDSARVHGVKATGYLGTVLAAVPNLNGETAEEWHIDFNIGDRVAVGIHADELMEQVIWARNGQVHAVVTG